MCVNGNNASRLFTINIIKHTFNSLMFNSLHSNRQLRTKITRQRRVGVINKDLSMTGIVQYWSISWRRCCNCLIVSAIKSLLCHFFRWSKFTAGSIWTLCYRLLVDVLHRRHSNLQWQLDCLSDGVKTDVALPDSGGDVVTERYQVWYAVRHHLHNALQGKWMRSLKAGVGIVVVR